MSPEVAKMSPKASEAAVPAEENQALPGAVRELITPCASPPDSLTERVPAVLRRNLGLRLISLGLALALWFFVNAGQRGSLQSFSVPVNYRDLPPHFLIVNQHPDSVKIEVSGPRTLLSIIQPSRLAIKLNLSGAVVGQTAFRIDPDSFNLPRNANVTSISPSQIVLDIDRIVTRDVPVRIVTSGAVAAGYRVAALEANPHIVSLRGPSRELGRFEQVDSDHLYLEGVSDNLTRMLTVPSPAEGVRVVPDSIAVSATVSPVVVEREFRAIPITVRNSDTAFRIQPAHLNLTVLGPLLVLDKLDRSSVAYVDADGMAPGVYDAPIEITVPGGVELVRQSAEKVKLHIYRTKPSPHAG